MAKPLKELPVKVDNVTGEQIYTMNCIIDSHRRPPETPTAQTNDEESEDLDSEVPLENVTSTPTDAEDGLVRDRWRLISAVEAWPSSDFWLPQLVDYGHNYGKVIRNVVRLVNERHPDLTWDHSNSTKDIAGHVEDAKWEKSQDIPPGVNATLVVDPEYDAKAAMGLEKKTLRNGSIGLLMELKKSHPNMDFGEFVEKQGQVVDGQKVRWLPHAISDVRHMAFVPAGAGADPNAGRRLAAANQQSEKPAENVSKENTMNDYVELLGQICEKLGIAVALGEDSPMPANLPDKLLAHLTEYEGLRDRLNRFVMELTELGDKYVVQEGEDHLSAHEVLHRLPNRLELAKHGEAIIKHWREETLRVYDIAKLNPDKAELTEAEKRMRSRIEASSDIEYLQDLFAEYSAAAEARHSDSKRTSKGEDLPEPSNAKPKVTSRDRDIALSVASMFKKEGDK